MTFRDERRGPQQPPLPKPYEFVPLPAGTPATGAPAGHQRYRAGTLSGTFEARIIARSPVHVASGLLRETERREFPNAADYPLVKEQFRTGGTPAIPGTSLKGCIRSIVEAITRSSVQVTRSRDLPRDYMPTRSLDELDVAQRIFGALGYQGLVRFGDALLVEGRTAIIPTPPLYRPRSEASGTYTGRGGVAGRKFYMHGALAKGNLPLEACEVGSVFRLRMDFHNLAPAELGLVLLALGLGSEGRKLWPKLGGGKPVCLGTIEVVEPQVTTLSPQAAYDSFDVEPRPEPVAPLIKAAGTLVLEEQLQHLVAILRWPREDRSCPDRAY